jgi:hypothetical protein
MGESKPLDFTYIYAHVLVQTPLTYLYHSGFASQAQHLELLLLYVAVEGESIGGSLPRSDFPSISVIHEQ